MKTLNNILTEYEHIMKAEAELELPVLDKLVALGDISDYEYETTVSYYIDKKILVKELDESLKSLNADYCMIADGGDHSDGCAQTRGKFRHCYLFHCLCDHHDVCREDLLEINRVRLDFVCTRQKLYELKKTPLYFPEINEELLKMERWINVAMASGTKWIRNKLEADGTFLPAWDLKCSVNFHLSERSWHYKENEDTGVVWIDIDISYGMQREV